LSISRLIGRRVANLSSENKTGAILATALSAPADGK